MTFNQELAALAERYGADGYTVSVKPGPDDLPDFARAFDVQLCCRRNQGGVLVAAFGDRQRLADDPRVSRYAQVTGTQPGWRFDLAILGAEPPRPDAAVGDAHDLPVDQIEAAVSKAERAASLGFTREGLVAAWGAMEAAARLRLRTTGEAIKWTKPWPEMASDLYANDALSPTEFDKLFTLYQVRNRIAHGLTATEVDADSVTFIARLSRRLSNGHTEDVYATA